jgi:predicted transcriptional regulator
MDWSNFQRYNFETLEEAEQKLDSEHESDTQLTSIFEALLEKEKSPQELSDELELQSNSIRDQVSTLKDHGLVYSGGSRNSTKFYGLSVEELHDGDYIQGLD